MCSLFWQMENDQGDLSDIVRASGGGGGGSATATGDRSATSTSSAYGWSFPAEPMSFTLGTDDGIDDVSGSVIGGAQDNLLLEAEISSSAFYHRLNAGLLKRENVFSHSTSYAGDGLMTEEMKPCQLLTRMLPNIGAKPTIPIPAANSCSLSPARIKPLQNEGVKVNSLGGPNENGGLPLNPPRNTGVKRRKNQTKKVVCVPAPAAPNNRPSGEVVPSDLWAWRKYGQKPIKGSPYPRGYYRCSSSKGCSARKQVERSRTDPNMLVITYTSDHNHPWPTQRNALAGSTRSQPSKSDSTSKLVSPQIQNSIKTEDQKVKEELREATSCKTEERSSTVCGKEEENEMGDGEKSLEVDDEGEVRQEFQGSYRPFIPPEASQSDDFFSELGELEPDPLSLIFPHGFSTDEKPNEDSENKGLDPFSFFDWSDSSLSGARKGLSLSKLYTMSFLF